MLEQSVLFFVGMIFHPGRSHECCVVRATGGSLSCRLYLLAPLTGNKDGGNGIYGTPSEAYTNLVPDQQSLHPDGQFTLAFYTKWVMPERLVVVFELIYSRKASGYFTLLVMSLHIQHVIVLRFHRLS